MLSVKEYAAKYKQTQQGAMRHVVKGRWVSPDGITWQSYKNKGHWTIEQESAAPAEGEKKSNEPITPQALKAKKTVEEIKLLQNRNDKMRLDLMRDWNNCVYRAFSGFYGAVAGRINGLRIDKELADKLNDILKAETDGLQARIDSEMEEYEEANKIRIR